MVRLPTMPYSIAWLILIANLIDRVATGYGQSLAVIWDESSVSMAESSAPFKDIENQMKIENLRSTISGTLSIVDEVPNVENDDPHSLPIDRLIQDLSCLEIEFADQDCQRKPLCPLSISLTKCRCVISLSPLCSTSTAFTNLTPTPYISELH